MDFRGFGHVLESLKCLWRSLVPKVLYPRDLNENFKKMSNEFTDLCNRRDDIEIQIRRDRISTMPSEECKAWLKKVEEACNQVNSIGAEIHKNRLNISSRVKLGKRIRDLLEDLTSHIESSTSMNILIRLSSTDVLVQQILRWIRIQNTQKVGLWGMVGVGKTTVMKTINNHLETAETFDIFIWVTLSRDCNVRKLQNRIAERLQINIADVESDETVARRLFQRLENTKYLLLLDDVCAAVNLEMVGIPSQNKETGSMIILTTRSLDVCKKMDTDVDIRVKGLSDEEAWNLFRERLGKVVDSADIEPIAREIVNECAGLPVAILVMGGSLRMVTDVRVWNHALYTLRSDSFQNRYLEDTLLPSLMFSYNLLKDTNMKNCFLYCALYPKDHDISIAELSEHWRAEGFLDSTQNLETAYDEAHAILNTLISDSLLERSENGVKMHTVIRKLALRITSQDEGGHRNLVRASLEMEECPEMEEWEKAVRISLMDNRLNSLPPSPRCNSLSTLFLQSNTRLKTIPKLFFQHMHRLRVANLSETRLEVLPSSVSNLVNLRGLYIVDSYANVSLPSEIGALTKLEVMHVTVRSLPLEVRRLTSLRSLRVRFESEDGMRTMCFKRVIPSLCQLEDLSISFDSSWFWEEWCRMVNIAVAEDVGSLKNLSSLTFEFSTLECLEYFLEKRHTINCPELTNFRIFVSGIAYFPKQLAGKPKFEEKVDKLLRWCSGETVSSPVIIQVLNQACSFELFDHKTATNLLAFGVQNIDRLEVCTVEYCTAIETIVDGSGSSEHAILPNLESLELAALPNLRSICEGQSHRFTKLVVLQIWKCSKLRCVFTPGMVGHISKLEKLIVRGCEEMEAIVKEDQFNIYDMRSSFPKLKELHLYQLNKLVNFWEGVPLPQPYWPSLEDVSVEKCLNLRTLMNLDMVFYPSPLRRIRGETEWWESLEWENKRVKDQLQPFFVPLE